MALAAMVTDDRAGALSCAVALRQAVANHANSTTAWAALCRWVNRWAIRGVGFFNKLFTV